MDTNDIDLLGSLLAQDFTHQYTAGDTRPEENNRDQWLAGYSMLFTDPRISGFEYALGKDFTVVDTGAGTWALKGLVSIVAFEMHDVDKGGSIDVRMEQDVTWHIRSTSGRPERFQIYRWEARD